MVEQLSCDSALLHPLALTADEAGSSNPDDPPMTGRFTVGLTGSEPATLEPQPRALARGHSPMCRVRRPEGRTSRRSSATASGAPVGVRTSSTRTPGGQDDPEGSVRKVHGAAHPRERLPGHAPARLIAAGGGLHGAEHSDVQVRAADHGEGVEESKNAASGASRRLRQPLV